MRLQLIAEASIVGLALLIVHAAVDAVLRATQSNIGPTLQLFLSGAVGHIVFELVGLNAAFCRLAY